MPHILLGDDDEELTQLLQEYLHNHGVTCDCVHDGEGCHTETQDREQ
ncbi:hypothetical protein [Psychrobacter sp. ASPA161_6]